MSANSLMTVDSVSALQALNTSGYADKSIIQTSGYSSVGDGGGNSYYINRSDTTSSSDGGSILISNGGSGDRMRALFPGGVVNIRQWGANPSNSDDTATIQHAIDYGESFNLPVFVPAGIFKASNLTVRKVELFGMEGEPGRIVTSQASIIQQVNASSKTELLAMTTTDDANNFPMPYIHDICLQGGRTGMWNTSIAISGVASRKVFTVAAADQPPSPSVSEQSVFPYFGWCFFFSPGGYYIGAGVVKMFSTVGGACTVTLANDFDWFATPAGSGNLLTTACKVVWSGITTTTSGGSVNRADATLSGRAGIRWSGRMYGRVRNVIVESFHTGIAFSPSSDEDTICPVFENVTTHNCFFAGLASAVRGFFGAYDAIQSGYLFASGFRGSTSVDISLDQDAFRCQTWGFYNLPFIGAYSHLQADGCVSGMYANSDAISSFNYLLLDNCVVNGLVFGDGTAGAIGAGNGNLNHFGSARIRALLVFTNDVTTATKRAIWINGKNSPSETYIGSLEVLDYGQMGFVPFDYAFDIDSTVAHKLTIGYLSSASGFANFLPGGSQAPVLLSNGNLAASANPAITWTYGQQSVRLSNGVQGSGRNIYFDSSNTYIGGRQSYTSDAAGSQFLAEVDGANGIFCFASFNTPSFGATAVFATRGAAGTATSPAISDSGSNIGGFRSQGWNGTAFVTRTSLSASTTEAWTATANGSRLDLEVTKNGTTSRRSVLRINDYGAAAVGDTAGDADPSARLHLQGTDKGFLPPVLSETQLTAIGSPAQALQAYNSSHRMPEYYSGFEWLRFGASVNFTSIAAASYSAVRSDDLILVGSSGARSVTLPAASTSTRRRIITVKDSAGNAGGGTITINTSGGNIDGAISAAITTNYGVLRFFCDGSNWFII